MVILTKYLTLCLTLILILVFFYLAADSWRKYHLDRISTNVREEVQDHFQYPSITVCPNDAFKRGNGSFRRGKINFRTWSVEEIKEFYLKNVRSRQEVFYFVNQKTWSGGGHSCMTTKISEDPGRPCVFPFQKHNKTFNECLLSGV